jgi:hypothetical protein
MYLLTLFKNRYDNKTHKVQTFNTFNDLEDLLYKLSKVPGTKEGPKAVPLISPAEFQPNTTRANDNVKQWCSWCCMDVDEIEIDDQYEKDPVAWVKNLCDELVGDYHYVCYSTASSRVGEPKFRLVFPLSDMVEKKQIKHFWFALNSEIEGLADKQTKDLARMFYVPALYEGAYNFIFSNKTDAYIDPNILMAKHPYKELEGRTFLDRLPDALKQHVIEYRKGQMDNTDIHWSGYSDCPFFPKRLAVEYQSISGSGWYRKMYQIMIAIAGNAVKQSYPITAREIAEMCKQFDRANGNWYENRPIEREADGAIEWVYKNQ